MQIEEEVKNLKLRNKKVESDKAWETSWTRSVLIMAFTYIIAAIWLFVIKEKDFWLKAFVPTGGYFLSTISLPFFKKEWLRRNDL